MGFLPRPIDLLNKTVGLAGVRITRGIPYGSNARHKLDVYTPARRANNLPVVIFLYGGSWQAGERADYAFVGSLFAARGYVTLIPDYRLYPETRYPGFVEDCAAALTWADSHVREYGGDNAKIFLMGHSAGAYNAVMVALGTDAPDVAGVIGLAGPYDFLPIKAPDIQAVFAGPEDPSDTQPISYAHGSAPPMFLACGAADRTVLPRNSTALAAKLRRLGAVVETRIYPRLGHTGILLGLLPYLAWRGKVLRDVLEFLAAAQAGEFMTERSEMSGAVIRRSL
jgi:acetyl esterase/lipase